MDGAPSPGEGVLHLEIGQPFENHNGGNLVFGPDGALWIGTGDGGGAGDRGEVAQDDESLLGKMLRVIPDPDGGVLAPSSNPDWERPEIWASGCATPGATASTGPRTASGSPMSARTRSRRSPSSTATPSGRTSAGTRSRAPTTTRASRDPGSRCRSSPTTTAGSCSITGGYVYRGDAIPSHGWYLYGDYCSGFVDAVPADDPTAEPVRSSKTRATS